MTYQELLETLKKLAPQELANTVTIEDYVIDYDIAELVVYEDGGVVLTLAD